jgi:hypothetical protein
MKQIKKLFLLMLVFLTSNSLFSQLKIDEFYENKEQLLIYSKIDTIENKNSEDIIKLVKNWAGLNFVNMNEVLVSETNDQLVFNYITKKFFLKTLGLTYDLDWYIRLVVQIKDDRIRLQFFDDGNAAMVNKGGVTRARIYRFTEYFNKKGDCLKNYNEGMVSVKNGVLETSADLFNSLTKEMNTDDNW